MIFFVLLWRKYVLMGTMSQKIKDMQSKRIAYQKEKTKVEMQRIATYLTEEEREIFFSGKGFVRVPEEFSGKGFVRVPEEERLRQRIDAYPYLIP